MEWRGCWGKSRHFLLGPHTTSSSYFFSFCVSVCVKSPELNVFNGETNTSEDRKEERPFLSGLLNGWTERRHFNQLSVVFCLFSLFHIFLGRKKESCAPLLQSCNKQELKRQNPERSFRSFRFSQHFFIPHVYCIQRDDDALAHKTGRRQTDTIIQRHI